MSTETTVRRAAERPTIGVLTKQLDNWTSGSGHHLSEIIQHALKQNNGRFRFIFFHYQKSENSVYLNPNVEEVIIPRNPFAASKIIKRHKPDLVHYPLLTAFAPIWGVKAQMVGTLHASEQLLIPHSFSAVEVLHELLIVPLYTRKMDHIVTVSHTSKEYYVKHHRIPPERFTVCYNGIDSAYRPLETHSLTAPEKYSGGKPYLFHISRYSERKNPWTLLRGYRRYLDTTDEKQPSLLIIAGGGWDNEKVRNFIEKEKLADWIILSGFVNKEEVVELYNGARAFLFPSLAEGFGMPNVEAMACGCPVITSRAFAVEEIVGDAALVMQDPKNPEDLAEKILLLLKNKDLRQNLIERGFKRLSLFSWEESAAKLLDIYAALTTHSHSRR